MCYILDKDLNQDDQENNEEFYIDYDADGYPMAAHLDAISHVDSFETWS